MVGNSFFLNVNDQKIVLFEPSDPRFALKCNLVPLKKFRTLFEKNLQVIFDDSFSFEK